MDRNTSYLLTGETGFLGKEVSKFLTEEKYQVTGLQAVGKSEIDITQPFVFESHYKFDVIVHIAGKAHSVPRNPKEAAAFYDVNFNGTQNLCHAISSLAIKPKAFIFISTVSVYGLDSGVLISEGHPLNGTTPYAKSKIMAEEWLINWASSNHIKLGILRLPLIAGHNPLGNLKAMINGIRSGLYFSIGKADAKKSMVWANDVAAIIPVLAEVGGIYNVTDGYHPSFNELEHVISNAIGRKRPKSIPIFIAKSLAYVGDMVGSKFPVNSDKLKKITSTLTFDDSKARQHLGWKPNLVLEKIIETI